MKIKNFIKQYILNGSRYRIGLLPFILCLCIGCGDTPAMMLEQEETVADSGETQPEENPQEIMVYVCGAVNAPGVYSVGRDDRIIDCVNAAGGFVEDACREAVNLSGKVNDEDMIYIPSKEEIDQGNTAVAANDPKININTAQESELTSLKGIGESKARAIIEYRTNNGPFARIEDIMKVSGIGQGYFDKIKDDIRVK